MTKIPKVIILILNWNGLKDTIECIESIRKVTFPNFDIVVIDNGSDGDDADNLSAKYAGCAQIIRHDKNYGFAGGMNRGIKYAVENLESDYLLLLNNDTIVKADFLTKLIDACESDYSIAVAGPKVLYYDCPSVVQDRGNKIDMFLGIVHQIDNSRQDDNTLQLIQDVDFVDTCILLRACLIKPIGLFDETYFLYWEDADYCTRVRELGYRVISVQESVVWHKKSITQSALRSIIRGEFGSASLTSVYYFSRNRFKFMRKYSSSWQYLCFRIFFSGIYVPLAIIYYAILKRDRRLCNEFLRGVKDGFKGL